MKTSRFLWRRLDGCKAVFACAFGCIVCATVLNLIPPFTVKVVIDYIIGDLLPEASGAVQGVIALLGGRERLLSRLWIAGAVVACATLLAGISSFGYGLLTAKASQKSVKRLREGLFSHIQRLPYSSMSSLSTGDVIQRCTSDVETLRRFLSDQLVGIGRIVVQITAVFIVMFSQNTVLALASLPLIPVVGTYSLLYLKRMKPVFRKTDEAEGAMMGVLQENLTGVKVVRAFGRERFEIDKFSRESGAFQDLDLRLGYMLAGFWSFSDCICMLQILFILSVGCFLAADGSASPGTVILFLTYEMQLLWPVRQLAQILSDVGKLSVSVSRLAEIEEMPREAMRDEGLRPVITGAIEFEDVSFSYPDGVKDAPPALDKISFKVEKGMRVGILGPTGSGKSSLVGLLLRLYDYSSGSVKLDGAELKEIDKSWLRRHVGLVPQEVFLYSKTLEDNIAAASKSRTPVEMEEAVRIAQLEKTVAEFPSGLSTMVGERGVTLSGGQKQRVAIARTILGGYPVLIFDDSLSSVDTLTDAAIRHALSRYSRDLTTIIVSHRITTIFDCDLILVIENGRLTDSGTHAQLCARPGFYRKIWLMQQEDSGEPGALLADSVGE